MGKGRFAAWVMATATVAGGGIALADTAPPDPVVEESPAEPAAELETVDDAVVEDVVVTEADVVDESPEGESEDIGEGEGDEADPTEAPETEPADGSEATPADGDVPVTDGGDEPVTETKAHPENHGAVVSQAAHDHSHDAECGNHGKYVSSVAKGGTGCAPAESDGDAPEDAIEGEGDDAGDAGDADGTAARGHGRGKAHKSHKG